MIFSRIFCSGCGYEGPREIPGTETVAFTADVFIDQGHDPYSGMLYYRCPKCGVCVAVDPGDALEEDTVNGALSPCQLELSWRLGHRIS